MFDAKLQPMPMQASAQPVVPGAVPSSPPQTQNADIDAQIKAIWADSTLTDEEKKRQIQMLVQNAGKAEAPVLPASQGIPSLKNKPMPGPSMPPQEIAGGRF